MNIVALFFKHHLVNGGYRLVIVEIRTFFSLIYCARSTTPSIPGYKIIKILGVVTGLTPRTRGVLGQIVGGIQSMFGGEVTAFTTELEKARIEAMERVRAKALALGANAIIGLDLETSDM
jgi:uncharacterized protein YbjQ (UPF0145 family)